MFGSLPTEWESTHLQDSNLFNVRSSGVEEFEETKTYLSTSCVKGVWIVDTEGEIQRESRPSRANLQPDEGAVCFAKMRDSKKVLRIDEELAKNIILSTGFIHVDSAPGVNSEYLKQVLASERFESLKSSLAIGSTQPAISNSDLSGLRIPIPPTDEQRKIATVLCNIDQAIQKTKEIRSTYSLIHTSLRRGFFGKQDGNTWSNRQVEKKRLGPKTYRVPEDWEIRTIGEIGKVVTGDTPETKEEANYGGSLPFVTPQDFGPRRYVEEGRRWLSEAGQRKARPIPEEAVMMDCIGMDMGKTRLAGCRLATNQQINSVIVGDEVLPQFLYYHLSTLSNLIKSQAGQTRTPIVSKSQFKKFEVFVPPLSDQKRVVDTLGSLDDRIMQERRYEEQLTKLKTGLVQDLLSGEVRTHDKDIEILHEVKKYD